MTIEQEEPRTPIHTIRTFTRYIMLAGVMLAHSPTLSHAADVTWGVAQGISGESDVSTDGTLVAAFNLGDTGVSAETVNGVLFQAFEVPFFSTSATTGNFALTISGTNNFLSDNTIYGSASGPFSGLSSAPYKSILTSAAEVAQPSTFDLIMTGLTSGQTYQFQWWTNFSGIPAGSTLHSATAGNTITLNDNVSGLEGGLGQFVVGTFVADASSQTVRFGAVPASGPASTSLVNAFQLRQVPEPSSLGLLGLGMLMLGCRTRCRKRG